MTKPKLILDFTPHNLPPEVLHAIGLAMVCGAQTENTLDAAVGGVLGLESDYTIAATAHMSMPLKISIIKSAAELRLEVDALDELDSILDTIDTAAAKRNTYAHDTWYVHPETGQVCRVKETSRVRLEVKAIPVTVEDIKADAEAIYNAGLGLVLFLDKYSLFPPHPPAPRQREHKSPAARKLRRKKNGN